MNMGLEAGASRAGENSSNAVWSVVSKMTRPDGYVARYAHLIDMSKPGCIAVNAKGERFGNEASVHFVDDMHANGAVPAHIIGDAAFVKKYGMGMRSEEHTSELQSLMRISYAVFCLKKKNK